MLPSIQAAEPLGPTAAAAEHDAAVAAQFMRVIGLLDPPSRLMRPSIIARTLRAGARSTPAGVPEITPVEGRGPAN